MKELAKQLASTLGAAFAAACCLGFAAAISVLTAIGAGFLVNDAVLIPLFVALLALSVWLLYRSAKHHARLGPFWLGLAGALLALLGMWTSPILIYAGLLAIIAGDIADFVNSRRQTVHPA